MILVRLILIAAFVVVLFVPAWWLAGRIENGRTIPFFRFLCAIGVALIGYISFINLVARLIGNSIIAILIYLALNAAAGIVIWRRWPDEIRLSPLVRSWRLWIGPVLIAFVVGFPQWIMAVSSNYFDEVVASSIHITAPSQFAEGVFPPRHNALPDLPIKYHYAVTILNGTVKWLTGLSANVSIDVVSTCLWLFVFLFVYFWLRKLELGRAAATWGGFTVLLGGGLAWLYLPHIESYKGIEKVPPPKDMVHHFDAAKSWLENLVAIGDVPSQHLRNSDGSLSNLPWDIGAQFQQHAVALGIALGVFALYLFVTWQRRKDFHLPLLIANIVTFGVLFLAHAVFGSVAFMTAALFLLGSWVRHPTKQRFYEGAGFGLGVSVLALVHGGLLVRGPQYGIGAVTTFRTKFGYPAGGLSGFLNWNLAGFGLPLLLAIIAWCLHFRRRDRDAVERNILFTVLTVFAAISWFVPQLMFYSSETYGIEQFTEISKFFFCTHLALAMLSAFGVAYLLRPVRWSAIVIVPGLVLMAITPLVFIYSNSIKPDHSWMGFYHAPYFPHSIEQQMGEAFGRLKKTSHDVYFDASADERRHGFLNEMLFFGGSGFTLTPSAYERTGIGFRISESLVARRFVQSSRMARLLPGAAEDCHCSWYYSRPVEDMTLAPLIVRSRFRKLVSEGYFVKRFEAGRRVLYSIDKPTADLDRDIDLYWDPRVVSQSKAMASLDTNKGLIFYDLAGKRILVGADVIELPAWLQGEPAPFYTARFPGDSKPDFLFGRIRDTEFRLGKKIEDVIEYTGWGWTYRDSNSRSWDAEYQRWLADWDIPLIADVDHDGFDNHIAYRVRTKEWLLAPNGKLNGPTAGPDSLPMPLAGRFLKGSTEDLGLWTLRDGMITLQSLNTGQKTTFKWGGRPGDILVPGDYDGDGYDEIGVWQRTNQTWYWRRAPDGPISQATFGTATGIPLPADYNHDGRLDLAYWEPRDHKIFVSYTQGRSVGLVIPVPSNSIPAFVNMY
jgi:hypothetical protein